MKTNDYIEIIRPFLSDKRYEHSIGVAEEAAALAKKYGVNVQKARDAGLLHDIMKDLEPVKQLKMLADFGIILTDLEKSAQKLWHAMLGAEYARRELHVEDEEVLAAIRYHTTGRAGMGPLEKVLFVADFTSADRSYPGVEGMRCASRQGLDKAMLEGAAFTICDLAQSGKVIHPDTLATYNELILERKA